MRRRTSVRFGPGESERVENCGYLPELPGTVNENAAPPVTFGSDGCATLTVEHVRNEHDADDCGFVRINGVVYESKQGSNRAEIEGAGANSASARAAGAPTPTASARLALRKHFRVGRGSQFSVGPGWALPSCSSPAPAVLLERRRLARRLPV